VGKLWRRVRGLARRPVGKRAAWGVVDQGLSSVTNFAVSILIVRSVTAHEFGAYALVFSTYLLLMGSARSLLTDPLVIRCSGLPPRETRPAQAAATGGGLLFGLVFGTVIFLGSFLLPAGTDQAFRAFAVVLPGLLLQDMWRMTFFANATPAKAALNDAAWGVVQLVAIIALLVNDAGSIPAFVLAWGGGATFAAVLACVQGGLRPRVLESWRWMSANRDLGLPFLGAFGAQNGGSYISLYGLPVVASLATVGTLKAAQVLIGPLNVFFMSIVVTVGPEAVRVRDRSVARLRKLLAVLGVGTMMVAVGWGVVLLLLPRSVGVQLLGENWDAARPVLIPLIIYRAALGLSDAAVMGLRVVEAAQRTLRLRLIITPLAVSAVLLGGWAYGAVGAATGSAILGWLAVPLWWRHFLRESRGYDARAAEARLQGFVENPAGDEWATGADRQ
jgi:O-antigen/teichoic acid export membrane protein